MKKKIAVIGMGISGLKTACDLLEICPEEIESLTFFEKTAELGGVLKHTQENHFLLEHGAQGVLLSKTAFIECTKKIGLENKILIPPQKLGARYLIVGNHCVKLSSNLFLLFKKKLLNFKSLWKIFKVFILKKKKPYAPNETLYQYIERLLGKKIADHFFIPFCFGIWGGGAKRLLCRFCFPKFPDMKKTSPGLGSFQQGMNVFPKTLFAYLQSLSQKNNIPINVFYNTQINQIHVFENGLTVEDTQKNKSFFQSVVYGAQPWLNENLSFGTSPQHINAMNVIAKIPTHSIVVVGVGGEKNGTFPYPCGFGALANQSSPDLLGILYIHSTYPDHVPQNHFLYRVLLGGELFPNISELSDEEFLERTKTHLLHLKLLAGSEKISFTKVVRYNNYIPLATVYQDNVLEALWKLEALNPGLFFAGNYIQGVAVSDCLEQASQTALNIKNYLLECC